MGKIAFVLLFAVGLLLLFLTIFAEYQFVVASVCR
jgi:hypothetical protein